MKAMKKILALALAGVMTLGAVSMVSATTIDTKKGNGNFTVTIEKAANDKATHEYEAYQIFKGDLSGTETAGKTTGKLSNIEWGTGVNGTALLADLVEKYPDDFNVNMTAEKVAEALGKISDPSKVEEIAQIIGDNLTTTVSGTGSNTGVTGLNAGYYLVKDKDGTLAGATNGAYTQLILQVVGNQTVKEKADVPTVDKEVQDNETADPNDEWDETADHKINESFQFRLTATIPGTVDLDAFKANGKPYKVVFTDTMSAGVTFESIASVAVSDGTNNVPLQAADYTETASTATNKDGLSWTLTIADLTAAKFDSLDTTQSISVVVVYNAHLNEAAIVGNTDVVNGNAANGKANENTVKLTYSNNPNATGGETTNDTPEDHVFVFSYKLDNIKKVDKEDGDPLAGAGFKIYAKADQTNALKLIEIGEANGVKKYRLKTAEDTAAGIEEMTSQSDGTFNIIGLDVGEYVLKETTTPPGYTTAADVEIKITATHEENASTTGADLTLEKKNVDNTIVDLSGATLPSTGGMGTTIFYIIGAILVIGAGILLVSKKRMSAN